MYCTRASAHVRRRAGHPRTQQTPCRVVTTTSQVQSSPVQSSPDQTRPVQLSECAIEPQQKRAQHAAHGRLNNGEASAVGTGARAIHCEGNRVSTHQGLAQPEEERWEGGVGVCAQWKEETLIEVSAGC